jgi:hypothetical protein
VCARARAFFKQLTLAAGFGGAAAFFFLSDNGTAAPASHTGLLAEISHKSSL